MKQALLIISGVLILFTTACAAALLIPAAVVLSHGDSQEAKVKENIPMSAQKMELIGGANDSSVLLESGRANSASQNAKASPTHISGVLRPELHISGSVAKRNHISGKSFDHLSGGSFY